jgi:hypothetical protein
VLLVRVCSSSCSSRAVASPPPRRSLVLAPLPKISPPKRVYVEQLECWQYYPRYVVGKTGDKLFVFKESTHTVRYFITENELSGEIKRKGLGQPVSERKTPADGWNETWPNRGTGQSAEQ